MRSPKEPHFLILPGLNNSGPAHWQTLWEKDLPRASRVHQADWDRPLLDDWLAALGAALAALDGPVVLVAHSLACSLCAHFAQRHGRRNVLAAFLVAPADVDDRERTPPETRSFAPIPLAPLAFPTTVVASGNDPYISLERAHLLATRWGARFVDAGQAGHLNAASGLGTWPEGLRLLDALLAEAQGTLPI